MIDENGNDVICEATEFNSNDPHPEGLSASGIVKFTFSAVLMSVLVSFFCSFTLFAGPPFNTDDPRLLPYPGGEAYLFSSGTFDRSGATGIGPAIEFNYEFIKKGFSHLILPLAFNDQYHAASYFGRGDIELGFKYQFSAQKGWFPAVATFPLAEIPTGKASEGLGNGKPQYFIPVWLEEDIGKWTVYGGSGYWINHGANNKNYLFSGILVQYNFTNGAFLGMEFFHHTPSTDKGSGMTGIHLGGGFPLYKKIELIFSGNPGNGITKYKHFSYYLGLHYVFG